MKGVWNDTKLTNDQRKLVEQNHNLIYAFLHTKNLNIEEWYDVCAISLCKASQTFNSELGTRFSSYAYKCMQNGVKGQKRIDHAKHRTAFCVSLNDITACNKEGQTVTYEDYIIGDSDVWDKMILLPDIKKFKSRYQKILHLRCKGYNQTEIAEIMKLSQCHVSRILNKIKEEFQNV